MGNRSDQSHPSTAEIRKSNSLKTKRKSYDEKRTQMEKSVDDISEAKSSKIIEVSSTRKSRGVNHEARGNQNNRGIYQTNMHYLGKSADKGQEWNIGTVQLVLPKITLDPRLFVTDSETKVAGKQRRSCSSNLKADAYTVDDISDIDITNHSSSKSKGKGKSSVKKKNVKKDYESDSVEEIR